MGWPPRQHRTCAHCAAEFKPKHQASVTYCSRDCAFKAKARTPFSKIHTGYCLECGTSFVSRRKRNYCSDKCMCVKYTTSTLPESKTCRCCGESYKPAFTGGGPSQFCSTNCKMLMQMAAKRAERSKRKAAKRAVTVESVDPIKVFERDKWKCQLCGVKTPRAKRGTYDPDAPELDHIIPLAKRGEHSYRNTQCACRKCNGEKSDRPLGQLRLIG